MRAWQLMIVVATSATLAASVAWAGEQQVALAVTVRLHAATKLGSSQELCLTDAALDPQSLKPLGVGVRVECPLPDARARAPEADKRALPERRLPAPEVTVSY